MLRSLEDWDEYLLGESRLPGRRANIELARAVGNDPDIRWIMRENLKKKRLARMDPGWVTWGLSQV